MSNHMPSKVWDEIAYPFINFNVCTVEVEVWIPYNGFNYLHVSMLGTKLTHVSKRGPWIKLASTEVDDNNVEGSCVTCITYINYIQMYNKRRLDKNEYHARNFIRRDMLWIWIT